MTPPGTSVGGRVRTISATSVDGSEQSFADQGFEPVSLNAQTHFESPRMVASKVNEDRQLSDLPGNKSLTFEVLMTSDNPNVSPVVDLDRVCSWETYSNVLRDTYTLWDNMYVYLVAHVERATCIFNMHIQLANERCRAAH